ncbi:hypothetical protein GR702_12560 [Novosphingobium sp. FGD1]|uniref:Uncharacterized protein n=1 Tax=Novosphingobium silvae TaxID=2692619 RepID=A0A7X4GIX5_9SPHN|nr:hypothetical protein [Novosphingobium silvae]MYL98597.1 hypothetical protein [Novosphingobium silvae]
MIRHEDYVRELQKGILLIADHLARLKGHDAAIAFAGFPAEGDYADDQPEKVDLTHFGNGMPLLLMYDFAMGSCALEPSGDFEESALASFIDLVPRTNAYGEPAGWPDDPLTTQVLDMFRARQKLSDPDQRATAVFSVRELALLADMREGAVRNALSAKELSSHREDGKVVVSWAEAAAWLLKKRRFRPTPDTTSQFIEFETASSLTQLLAALAAFPGAEGKLPTEWLSGRWSGNLSEVQAVAHAIRIDPEKLAIHMSRLWVREQQ